MIVHKNINKLSCAECAGGAGLGFEISMAFQPIVDINSKSVFAQEALVRGPHNESSAEIFKLVNDSNRYRFDQSCRVTALKIASQIGIDSLLSINFMSRAVYRPELCIRTTLEAAEEFGFPVDQLILEVTETEMVDDHAHLRSIVQHYKERGFRTAIDDFGAGYSGLNLLAEYPVDYVKLDIALIKDINEDRVRRAIVKGIIQVCGDLSSQIIVEGIETYEEMSTLRDMGVELFQGFYFAKPAFQALASVAPELYR